MAVTLQIKRSTGSSVLHLSLVNGVTFGTGTQSNLGDRVFYW